MKESNVKLSISAVIVSKNEGHLLRECLTSLQFCKEVIVVDLKSTDETKIIADDLATRYMLVNPVPIVEKIREWIAQETKYDWVLYVDPDERYSDDLVLSIISKFSKGIDNSIGSFELPIRYYFDEYQLKGTYWGGVKYKTELWHRNRSYNTGVVHADLNLMEGFYCSRVVSTNNGYIIHKWMRNKSDLHISHERYLQYEGISMYSKGKRYSRPKQIIHTLFSWLFSFIYKKGFLDGHLGFYLSNFYSRYVFKRWTELKKYQRISQNA